MGHLISHRDPVTDILSVFDSVFRPLVPNPAAREFFKLKGISEKILGDPGWYVWFTDIRGAYLLELAEASHRTRNAAECFTPDAADSTGTFLIKYYPDLNDFDTLETFSPEEQEIRKSDSFDGTGTPDFEAGSDLPPHLFVVGSIDVALSANGHSLALRLEAPDRWVVFSSDAIKVCQETPSNSRRPETPERNVAAWTFSWQLLNHLIEMLCLGHRTIPSEVALHEAEGAVFVLNSSGTMTELSDPNVHWKWLTAGFPLKGKSIHAVDTLLPLPTGGLLARCVDGPSSEPVMWISPSWWKSRDVHLSQETVPPC